MQLSGVFEVYDTAAVCGIWNRTLGNNLRPLPYLHQKLPPPCSTPGTSLRERICRRIGNLDRNKDFIEPDRLVMFDLFEENRTDPLYLGCEQELLLNGPQTGVSILVHSPAGAVPGPSSIGRSSLVGYVAVLCRWVVHTWALQGLPYLNFGIRFSKLGPVGHLGASNWPHVVHTWRVQGLAQSEFEFPYTKTLKSTVWGGSKQA